MAKNKIQLTSPTYGKTTGLGSSSSKGSTSTKSGTSSKSSTSSKGGTTSKSSTAKSTVDTSRNYHQEAVEAAARGDWKGVDTVLSQRQAKINQQGGNDRGTSNQQILAQLQAQYGRSTGSTTRPSSGGSSYGTTTTPKSTVDTSRNYHKEASDAAARGDWSAVSKALADRQAKIDADGYGDRGMSNQQIYEQLKAQYGDSYGALSKGSQDKVGLNAGMKLPYDTSYGTTGQVYKDKGWQDGVDYLSEARRLASEGDLDGAYDALMRRGFKLADGGSPTNGGGTSQDLAYADIHRLYNQSDTAREQYLNAVSINRQRLAEHPTQFGSGTNPALANKRFVSQDGRYLILYDQNGTPSVALPNKGTYTKYSPEEIDLMSRYYNGDETTDFAELDRQIHNNSVVRTGVGRLIDQEGNYASGTPSQPIGANDWTGLPQTDRYQDKAALQDILNQINAGQSYAGGSTQVPTDALAEYLATLPSNSPSAGGTAGIGFGGGLGGFVGSGGYGYGPGDYGLGDYGLGTGDLTAYLRQIFQNNLDAELANLQAVFEQNTADYRAHDDLIAQAYRDRQNQAAAQNDLQRMHMAEMGNMQGLNTGATGQLALAQSAAYQAAMAEMMAAEGQDHAANDLEMQKLEAAYRGNVASAQARSSAELGQAVYNELVRMLNQAEARRQADQAQANWELQFAYQQQQDEWERQKWQAQWDYNQQADQRDAAYNMAATMLKNGVLPDSATLASAGISQADAAAMVQAYQQAAIQSTKKTTKSSPSTVTGGGGTQDYSGLFNAAYGSEYGAEPFISNNYKKYGFTSQTGLKDAYAEWAVDSGKLNSAIQSVNASLTNGNVEAAHGYVRSIWGSLSGREREQLQSVLNKYGIQYTP